jgi:dTMP kinase
MAGSFIVFEGPDGSGTTRQSHFLAERMRTEGYDVLHTAEPTDGSFGAEVRSLLHTEPMPPADSVQLLFCADRAQHVQELIEPALKSGKVVISDRYILSTLIYGVATGLDEQWLKDINRTFPSPDLTIITLPPLEVCLERLGTRESNDQFENALFQKRIYEGYRNVEDPATIFADTSDEKEKVAESIWGKVQEHFGPISRESITKL